MGPGYVCHHGACLACTCYLHALCYATAKREKFGVVTVAVSKRVKVGEEEAYLTQKGFGYWLKPVKEGLISIFSN